MAKRVENPNDTNCSDDESAFIRVLDKEQPYQSFNPRQFSRLKDISDTDIPGRIQGSLIGLAVGDALGASVEFRPRAYLVEHEVKDMQGGGTWGLQAGQWTDDTSMALCLAASLIVNGKSDAYDQFVRYRRWYREGYMSSTGKCFDIGKATRDAITAFESLYQKIDKKLGGDKKKSEDAQHKERIKEEINKDPSAIQLGAKDSAGNGPLMRLAPIPCFFFQSYEQVKAHIDKATQLTHGDPKAIEACQFYAGLIWYALKGRSKAELLDQNFYQNTLKLELRTDVKRVAEGSYKKKKNGYEDGIRGKGYVVDALEAALWAFYTDDDKFEIGALKAVNLGDDTDTTAAIYGELAGAVYGIHQIPQKWVNQLYQKDFIIAVAKYLYIMGERVEGNNQKPSSSSNKNQPDYGGNIYIPRHHDQTSADTGESSKSKRNESDTRHQDSYGNAADRLKSSPQTDAGTSSKTAKPESADSSKTDTPSPHVIPE